MQIAPTSRPLKLASHVRACQSEGNVVLLDLRHNRYLGIGSQAAQSLASQVEGWPVMNEGPDQPPSSERCCELTLRLLAQGLLTDQPTDRAVDHTIEPAVASFDACLAPTGTSIGAKRLANFLLSSALAAWWMRCRALSSIATSVAARRKEIRASGVDSGDAMLHAMAAYQTLRPLVFTSRDRCLYDSLALMSFLATEGISARWVVGVRTSPFGAHSWVQSGHTVLNDHHEYVGQFRPILVV